MNLAKMLPVFLAGTLAHGPAPADLPPSEASFQARLARLDATLEGWRASAGVPGLALAVIRPGGTPWVRVRGLRQTGGESVTAETVFEAASLSKPVCAWVALRLADAGRLDLDQPLVELFDYEDLAHDDRRAAITARMCLSHTTGLPNWRPEGGRLEIGADPGTSWRYSGEGFVLLQRVLEKITGEPLEALAREHVFGPLGMSRTSYVWRADFADDHAVPHDAEGNPWEKERAQASNAAYSLQTTAGDYARFVGAVLSGEGLAEATAQELLQSWTPVSPGVSWGLGLGLEDHPEGPAFWHWGHNRGFRAYVVGYPARGYGMVVFLNGNGGLSLLADLLETLTGSSDHPAVPHLDYRALETPRHDVAGAVREALRDGVGVGIDRFFQGVEEHGEDALGPYLLGALAHRLLDEGRVEEALELLRVNAELFPGAADALAALAEALHAEGDPEAARGLAREALELDSGHAAAAVLAR